MSRSPPLIKQMFTKITGVENNTLIDEDAIIILALIITFACFSNQKIPSLPLDRLYYTYRQ